VPAASSPLAPARGPWPCNRCQAPAQARGVAAAAAGKGFGAPSKASGGGSSKAPAKCPCGSGKSYAVSSLRLHGLTLPLQLDGGAAPFWLGAGPPASKPLPPQQCGAPCSGAALTPRPRPPPPPKACCGKHHGGEAAGSPEALLRARFSAYKMQLVDYLVATTHRENPEHTGDDKTYARAVARTARANTFLTLKARASPRRRGAGAGGTGPGLGGCGVRPGAPWAWVAGW
jgi:hypothetical protein